MFLPKKTTTTKDMQSERDLEEVKTTQRTYRLHKDFLYPKSMHNFFIKSEDIARLTVALDNYY